MLRNPFPQCLELQTARSSRISAASFQNSDSLPSDPLLHSTKCPNERSIQDCLRIIHLLSLNINPLATAKDLYYCFHHFSLHLLLSLAICRSTDFANEKCKGFSCGRFDWRGNANFSIVYFLNYCQLVFGRSLQPSLINKCYEIANIADLLRIFFM